MQGKTKYFIERCLMMIGIVVISLMLLDVFELGEFQLRFLSVFLKFDIGASM